MVKIVLLLYTLISVSSAVISFEKLEYVQSTELQRMAIEILTSCVSKKIRTMAIMNEIDNFIMKLISLELFDVVTIDGEYLPLQNTSRKFYKLHYFVINVFDEKNLSKSFNTLKSSSWWNHQGQFIILERDPSAYCSNVESYFETIFDNNIIDGILLCTDATGKINIFTFNPYSNVSSGSWIFDRVKQYNYTIYIFKFINNSTYICNEIFFKLPNDLNGFTITANTKNYPPTMAIPSKANLLGVLQDEKYKPTNDYYYIKPTFEDWNIINGTDSLLIQEFLRFYNATILIKVYDKKSFGRMRSNGTYHGMLLEQKNGAVDIGLNNRFMLNKGVIPLSYPYEQSRLTLVTHFRGDMNILMRIILFINLEIFISIIVICFLTIVVCSYFIGRGVELGMFDTFRMLLGVALDYMPINFSPRIVLLSLMLYYSIISSSVQSNFFAIVSAPRTLKNINSLDDAIHLRYKLFAYAGALSAFDRERFKNIEFIENDHCIEYVLNSTSAGCIDDYYFLRFMAAKHGLHVMREAISNFYLTNPMRIDWPLEYKFNALCKRLNEAGFLKLFMEISDRLSTTTLRRRAKKYNTKKFKVLKLSECTDIFCLWLIGMIIATITFVGECRKYSLLKLQNKKI